MIAAAALYLALASGAPASAAKAPPARLASGVVIEEVVMLGRCGWQRSGKDARDAITEALKTGGVAAFYEAVQTEPGMRQAIKACQTGTPLSEDDANYIVAAEALHRLMVKNFLDDEAPTPVADMNRGWAAGGKALQAELDSSGPRGEEQLQDPIWKTVFAAMGWSDTPAMHNRRIWALAYFRSTYAQNNKIAEILGPYAPPCPADQAGCKVP